MRFLSICSGIEAASVAWEPLGWTPVGFSEIEPFPSALLEHHYPNVPNLGDMTKYDQWSFDDNIDIICGGTPCQAFSVAGQRKSLDDERGNLSLTFCRLCDKFDPDIVIWENVPGVLNTKECERLQGFPDDYTKIPYRGKPAEQCPDAPRYKALGNSWAVPVVRWIGERIIQIKDM